MDKISFKDFEKVDIRIGTVIEAEVPEWSHWVMKLVVDFGPAFAEASGGKRTRIVFAGIMKYYDVKDIKGKQFPFVVNMEPKKIGPKGDYSEGMLLAATTKAKEKDEDVERPVLFKLSEKVPLGSKVR